MLQPTWLTTWPLGLKEGEVVRMVQYVVLQETLLGLTVPLHAYTLTW